MRPDRASPAQLRLSGQGREGLPAPRRSAQNRYRDRLAKAWQNTAADLLAKPMTPWEIWAQGCSYAVDFAQRSVLFWDTLRQRGNNYLEHEARRASRRCCISSTRWSLDGRTFERPVNYALVRIVPPEGVTVDRRAAPVRHHRSARAATAPASAASRTIRRSASRCATDIRSTSSSSSASRSRARRCSMCARPSASSCAGCASCIRQPEAGDRRQLPGRLGGDDARRLEARGHRPDRHQRRADVVLGRRWREGEGDNPMRYAGGMLGGTWLASLAADLGDGQIRRRAPGAELREPESGQHVLGQVLQRIRQRRHRAAALPRVRALVGRLLPDEPRGDRVDHAAISSSATSSGGRGAAGRRQRFDLRESARRSSCSPRWATTSRRRSRRSTGSPTSTARPRRSRRTAR